LLFLDESHFSYRDFVSRFGRGFLSYKPYSLFQKLSKESFSLILCISNTGFVYYRIYVTSGFAVKTTQIFHYFRELYIHIKEGYTLIFDNATVHQNQNIKFFIMIFLSFF
jgi:hypothetical protein